ncbi:uncharacterized protein TRAVEDRAFT_48726 [Trametes versicolor FP-101664 SS1]|uniref:uncharacterized protein n=1 Tax=Trametes versicolor (strain FP-101664) TaxID=717944 RepID=UPI00046236F0|nr:uncharacterized protein TRAVEDRAFT_48726 [Trametes versicolor FP-101664 SS1]EIW57693.1 hypothetical protein TRAVEDRAFT_48726 [Trametes versicolor FP-101664 SS1]
MYGLPWRLSVLGLSAHRHFDWVVDQLLREDLLSFPEVRPYSRYLENSGLLGLPYISHHVDAGDEAPFGYNFGTSSPASAWIITSLPFLHRIGLRTFFRIDGAVPPRSGSAIFSVEWQYDRLKPGRYFYALRCHKIVEPLVYPSANAGRLALAAVAKAAGRILESTISPQEDDADASGPVDTQPGSPRCEIAEGHLVSLGGKPLLWARAYNGGPPRDEDDKAAAGVSK